MTSNFPDTALAQSPAKKRALPARPRSTALRAAVLTAPSAISIPIPLAAGSSARSASKRQPVPVPSSSTRRAALRSGSRLSTASITVSVSGRGSRVSADRLNSNPQNSPLRKIIGPDPLRSVAGADLALPLGSARAVARPPFHVVEARAKHLQRLRLVLVLRFLVLLDYYQSRRDMGDPHRAICRIHRLTARSARAEDIDAQVPLVDPDIDVLRLGKHGDCCGGGVNAAGRLGFR